MKTVLKILVLCLLLSCGKKNQASNFKKMQLRVISNYGANEMLVSDSVSLEQVRSKMVDLDWNSFHQVVLEQENGDWIEVGGNLLDDGLSAMYQEAGRQYVIRQTPKSVDQLTEILLSYLRGDNKFREDHKFH